MSGSCRFVRSGVAVGFHPTRCDTRNDREDQRPVVRRAESHWRCEASWRGSDWVRHTRAQHQQLQQGLAGRMSRSSPAERQEDHGESARRTRCRLCSRDCGYSGPGRCSLVTARAAVRAQKSQLSCRSIRSAHRATYRLPRRESSDARAPTGMPYDEPRIRPPAK